MGDSETSGTESGDARRKIAAMTQRIDKLSVGTGQTHTRGGGGTSYRQESRGGSRRQRGGYQTCPSNTWRTGRFSNALRVYVNPRTLVTQARSAEVAPVDHPINDSFAKFEKLNAMSVAERKALPNFYQDVSGIVHQARGEAPDFSVKLVKNYGDEWERTVVNSGDFPNVQDLGEKKVQEPPSRATLSGTSTGLHEPSPTQKTETQYVSQLGSEVPEGSRRGGRGWNGRGGRGRGGRSGRGSYRGESSRGGGETCTRGETENNTPYPRVS